MTTADRITETVAVVPATWHSTTYNEDSLNSGQCVSCGEMTWPGYTMTGDAYPNLFDLLLPHRRYGQDSVYLCHACLRLLADAIDRVLSARLDAMDAGPA